MPIAAKADKSITVIGGLLVDDIAKSEVYLRAGSSNPVQWQHRLGGVAANVARVAAQQVNTFLIAGTGDDNYGKELASLLAAESLSSSLIIWSDQPSDRYTAVLDNNGELFIGLADARLAEQLCWQDIKPRLPATSPDAIVLDANLSAQCINKSTAALNENYRSPVMLIALAVSPVKSVRFLPIADSVDVLFCNRAEAAALTGLETNDEINALADALHKINFRRFVLTDGAGPLVVQDEHKRTSIVVPKVNIQKNVNGAGDALAGATIAQLVIGQTLSDAVGTSGIQSAQAVLTGDIKPPSL